MIKEITREWLEKNNACQSGINDWKKENDHETITTIKRNIERNPKQANWIITKVMNKEQNKKYALFAALQVFPLWDKKYPKQAAVWKKWADNHANYATAAAVYAAIAATAAADADAATAAVYAVYAADTCNKDMIVKILNYGLSLLLTE